MLSPRQADIVSLLEQGYDVDQVAEHLSIGASTVRSQLNRMRAKYGISAAAVGSLRDLLIAIRAAEELERRENGDG